jgi:predicted dehydrogenase
VEVEAAPPPSEAGQIGIGVIGCGYWGPNWVRNFSQLTGSRVVSVADTAVDRLEHIRRLYPNVGLATDHRALLADPAVDAVVIALPVRLHHPVAMDALRAGKHVLVEKPMATSAVECREIIAEAEARSLTLMVGHTFEYAEAVRKIKSLIAEGLLGDLYYVNSQRLNLGLFQKDVNVVWDLAPHDISILLHMRDGSLPRGVQAFGAAHIDPRIEDVATVSLDFDDGLIAFLQCSWLDPKKVRQITFVGSRRMLIYNDIEPTEKIWIYDRGVETPPHYDTFDEFQYAYRYGDITVPRIGGSEPLHEEAQHFLGSIVNGKAPLSDGASGLRVVQVLEAANASLRSGGARIELPT